MKKIIPLLLLIANAGALFAVGPDDFRKELLNLGAPFAVPASMEAIPAPVIDEAFGLDTLTLRLRAEAAVDPETFIDEHTPYEVGLAFGLSPFRFPVTDPKKIENAAVRITVDLAAQRLVVVSSAAKNEFKISSGLPPHHATPGSGKCYAPDALEAMHYSSLYNNAPMPNTIFFNGNIAIHASAAVSSLGKPASHGCIRLARADSKVVYDLVRANGRNNTVICVKGVTPKF